MSIKTGCYRFGYCRSRGFYHKSLSKLQRLDTHQTPYGIFTLLAFYYFFTSKIYQAFTAFAFCLPDFRSGIFYTISKAVLLNSLSLPKSNFTSTALPSLFITIEIKQVPDFNFSSLLISLHSFKRFSPSSKEFASPKIGFSSSV